MRHLSLVNASWHHQVDADTNEEQGCLTRGGHLHLLHRTRGVFYGRAYRGLARDRGHLLHWLLDTHTNTHAHTRMHTIRRTHTSTRAHKHTHTSTRMYAHAHTHIHSRTHTHTHISKHAHTSTHAQTQAHAHSCPPAHKYPYAPTQRHTHTTQWWWGNAVQNKKNTGCTSSGLESGQIQKIINSLKWIAGNGTCD